ncbi:MAG: hypothetical protein ACE5F7_08055 [Nitrospiria bacterium]
MLTAQTIILPEVISKTASSSSTTLKGIIRLDPTSGADFYKVKIKSFGELRHTRRIAAGEPFEIHGIAPGYYDLVIEAKGHTTLVKEDVIHIRPKHETQIEVVMLKAPTIFKEGDATKIIMCSACHKKLYMEMMRGEGGDFHTGPWPGPDGKLIHLPDMQRDFYANSSPEHLAFVAPITVASIAKQPEEKRDACRSCHAPARILRGGDKPTPPTLREKNRIDGVTCASCHLDTDGNVHGKYDLSAPHPTVQNPLFTTARSAELCAACHQTDYSAPAQQTFLEWQRDFSPKDDRTCQSCHMPRVVRRFAKIFSDRPERAVGKHLFPGGHSPAMLKKAATLSIEQDLESPRMLQIGVTNSGAGHSLPTGHAPRAVLLHVKIEGPDGSVLIDTRKSRPLAVYTVNPKLPPQAESIHPAIRAGATEKTAVQLGDESGTYRVTAELYYDLDRQVDFNDDRLPLIASAEAIVNFPK